MAPIQEIMASSKYCIEELARIREVMGSREKFTERSADAIAKTLFFMLAYGPEKLQSGIRAHLIDLDYRRAFLLMKPAPTEGKGERG